MNSMRDRAKRFINTALAHCGLRLISAEWGPCGFAKAFARLADAGLQAEEIIDVGAARGCWTRECMTVFPHAAYFLADPLPANCGPLAALAATNPRVTVWNGAIGASTGTLDIHVHGDQSSAFTAADDCLRGVQVIQVPMRPLDSFLEDGTFRRPTILKADVQGYELSVLHGATEVLRSVAVVLLELSFRRIYEDMPLAHTVIGELAAHGFRIADICSYTQRARDRALLQSDMLFVRKGLWSAADERYL
jgi:FkbM family methyltransferase